MSISEGARSDIYLYIYIYINEHVTSEYVHEPVHPTAREGL